MRECWPEFLNNRDARIEIKSHQVAIEKRTTFTLPASVLNQAEEIAKDPHITLSTAVSEVLQDGSAALRRTRKSEEVLASYRQAFSGFTEEERFLLDGIQLEPELAA